MKCEQRRWRAGEADQPIALVDAALVLVFADRTQLGPGLERIRSHYPQAIVVGCSTAGEIFGSAVLEEWLVTTAVAFERTTVRACTATITKSSSRLAGRELGEQLVDPSLVHVFVLSEGLEVNGSDLVRGLESTLPGHVTITGGLSGDGGRFAETAIVCESVRRGEVVAVGFYGDALDVGFGSIGGWDSFGPERLITRADGSVLYELDGQSALALYRRYLGDYAAGLPATGLLFPLLLRDRRRGPGVVRTIVGVDEEAGTLSFAGDVPEGAYARLMKANVNRLVDGAAHAAESAQRTLGSAAELAICVSCFGRKMVMRQRVDEELEAVQAVLGATTLTGFYSYGEIAPSGTGSKCDLHNQTMTITTFSERHA